MRNSPPSNARDDAEPSLEKTSAKPKVMDLDDALTAVGLGWGQGFSMTAMSLMWIGQNMQLFVMFYLPQALKDDWGTKEEAVAWVDTSLFLGVAIGALIGGGCSDHFGRKPTVLWSAFLTSIVGFYNAYVSTFQELMVMRLILGLVLGAFAPAATSITLESCPQALRGRFAMAVPGLSGAAGKVAVALLADALYDDQYNASYARFTWRAVLVLCAVPTFMGLGLGVYVLGESPRWQLAVARRPDEASESLVNLALKNSCPEAFPRGSRVTDAAGSGAASGGGDGGGGGVIFGENIGIWRSLQKVFQPPLIGEVLLAIFAMTGVSIVYYGLIYILPIYIGPFALENGWPLHTQNLALVAVALSEFPAVLIMMYTVDLEFVGRRRSVALAALAAALCCLLLNFRALMSLTRSSYGMIGSNFLARGAAAAAEVSSVLYVAEIFPTATRATAVSICVFAGRAAAAAAPPLAGFLLLDFQTDGALGMWAALHPLRIHVFLALVAFAASACFFNMQLEPAGAPLSDGPDELAAAATAANGSAAEKSTLLPARVV